MMRRCGYRTAARMESESGASPLQRLDRGVGAHDLLEALTRHQRLVDVEHR